jgi:hypothetical protein
MQLTAQSKAIFRRGIARTKAAQKAAKELAALVLAQPDAPPAMQALARQVLEPVVVVMEEDERQDAA